MKYLLTFGLLWVGISSATGDETSSSSEEQAVRSVGKAYVQAFNSRDTKALAGFWSPEAVYINRVSGEQVTGRDAISGQFDALLKAEASLKLKADVKSIEFVSPNVAVEQGLATFLSANSEPESVDYSAVYIRRDGRWLLDRVTDDPKPEVRTNYEHLKDLEWMIGSWVDEWDEGQVATDCSWSKNKNFITRSFAVSVKDQINLSGIQFIGWDPAEKQIRSWTFDSDGGFSERPLVKERQTMVRPQERRHRGRQPRDSGERDNQRG